MNQLLKILCFSLLTNNLWAQSFILEGHFRDEKNIKTVYYAYEGQAFTKTQALSMDKQMKFRFQIDPKKVDKGRLDLVAFSLDTLRPFNPNESCFFTISLLKAIELKRNYPNIKLLKTEMYACTDTTSVVDGDDSGAGFGGKYILRYGAQTIQVSLGEHHIYRGILANYNKNWMNFEYGRWNYDAKKQRLDIWLHQEQNPAIGLLLLKNRIYSFKVRQKNGKIVFESDKYKLKRK